MTYTTKQLQAMSDFEVNKTLAEKLLAQYEHSENEEKKDLYCGFNGSMGLTYRYRDYCNNPSDIMPLAFERNISLIRSEAGINLDTWCACHGVVIQHGEIECDLSYAAHNPLRAIACLLLLIED